MSETAAPESDVVANVAGEEPAVNPTQHTWAFWEHRISEKKTMTKAEWANLQKKLFTFNSVEEFWKYYSHIPPPSEVFYDGKARKRVGVPPGDRIIESFSLFKDGIAPEWEDSANIGGGEWNLRKSGRGNEEDMIDEWWQNLVLGLIGEMIDEDDQVCGARVADKSGGKGAYPLFRVELWLRTTDEEKAAKLKENMVKALGGKGSVNADAFGWKNH